MEHSKDYTFFTTEDFIKDDAFQRWVKYPDAVNDAWWQAWLKVHPDKQQQVEAARAFISSLQFKARLPDQDAIAASLARNLSMIEAAERQAMPEVKVRAVRKLLWWAAAAAIIVSVVVVGKYFVLRGPEMMTVKGYAAAVRTVWLPDSSLVRLNAGATLSYRADWKPGAKREIWLKGEAFFEIKPSATGMRAANEFVVHSDNLRIDVLGTSFNVREGGASTTVTLNTGKIRLHFKELPETPFILDPGDFVQYQAVSNKIIRKKVNPSLYAVWKEERQYLDKVSLQDIGHYIEDTYSYHVKISNATLAKQRVSGSLSVKDEASLLETLSFALNLKIEKKGDTLFIQSSNQ
ncbi:FecR family protein [Chitinophaga filiformis]|uniref:Ferric-dicitrate binding protein FerR, regulates iron transport through sigma-19 n=1 Tax=Chitinophaga filiformis TaxID=104663 RepID=A0A1G7UFG4_CHIFI|nr:FecR domain-containing protein [Chitinophaga filiformis]SDG46233.1 ferric-dicitrate binding protein FerR, regulates iron transport through sigma-19 [Chitinophaga filiformis]